jgi:hypothetical protein
MLLLYITGDGRLSRTEDLIGETIPPYAILSHTWGGQEVTFKDLWNYNSTAIYHTPLSQHTPHTSAQVPRSPINQAQQNTVR